MWKLYQRVLRIESSKGISVQCSSPRIGELYGWVWGLTEMCLWVSGDKTALTVLWRRLCKN